MATVATEKACLVKTAGLEPLADADSLESLIALSPYDLAMTRGEFMVSCTTHVFSSSLAAALGGWGCLYD